MRSERSEASWGSRLGAGVLLGVLVGIVENVIVMGGYWYHFPTSRDMRIFAAWTVLLDVVAVVALTLGASLLSRRAGWPATVFTVVVGCGALHVTWNFPSAVGEAMGRTGVAALLLGGGTAAAWATRRLPQCLPSLGRLRLRFLLLFGVLIALLHWPDRLPAPTASGPNVLFVIVDTLRADRLGCTGDPRVWTPHVDRLSRAGAVGRNVNTTSHITTSSFASILTSTNVPTHGIDYFLDLLDRRFTTLAEVFQTRGYRTFGFTASFAAHFRYHQFDQGMDFVDDTTAPRLFRHAPPTEGLERLALARLIRSLGWRVLPQNLVSGTREAEATTDAAVEFLRRDGAEPFFGIVHYFDPHAPFNPPRMFSQYQGSMADISRGNLDEILAEMSFPKPRIYQTPVEVRDPRFVLDSYDGEVAYIDHGVGRIMAELAGRDSQTLTVLTADHGENLFEHDYPWGHKGLYEAVTTVPLIVAGPMVPANVQIPELAQTVDLMPTILDLVGLPVPADVEGRSLVDNIGGSGPTPRPALAVGSETSIASVRLGRYKLIRFLDHERPPEVYDLAVDPLERENLAPAHPDLLDALTDQMDRFMGVQPEAEARSPDRDAIDTLKALGYIE